MANLQAAAWAGSL